MPAVPDALLLVLGVGLAAGGGELFLRGTIGLAAWARVPVVTMGATVAAFATSAPELSVALSAASAGRPQVALGNALGSNVTVLALVVGLTALVGSIRAPRAAVRRDVRTALAVPALLAVLGLGGVSRVEGGVLLVAFAGWLALVVRHAHQARAAHDEALTAPGGWRTLVLAAAGLACLVAAGQLIVGAVDTIGALLGMDGFVVGAVLVAIGTCAPELATTLVARIRGHHDIGLGMALGSIAFNGLLVVGVAALIAPISVPWTELAVGLAAMAVALVWVVPNRADLISRRRGLGLVALYAVYVTGLTLFPGGGAGA